ncbi:MAG: hypothetical protein KKH72_10015 [Alphaproteobacteria bacterium]|nr:hypothetical protein [Alphaproteobacteria bacterium]
MSASLFSYVVAHDAGFSPNPFGRALTLACCKPVIRRVAHVGDWIVGIHSARMGRNLACFVAQVSETMDFDSYYRDSRFLDKRPTPTTTGDAIYFRDQDRTLRQIRNRCHGRSEFDHDTQVDRVLVCAQFWYFGSQPKSLPEALFDALRAGRGHRRTDKPVVIAELEAWLREMPSGYIGAPAMVLPGTNVEQPANCGRC